MGARYEVTGAAVVLPTTDGSERYLYRGGIVGDGYTEEGLKHALDNGLITEIASADELAAIAELAEQERAEQAAAEVAAFDAKVQAAAEQLVADRDRQAEADRVKAEQAGQQPPAQGQQKSGQQKPTGR